MKFTVSRETLLKPLQSVSGVIERKQTLPVLANVLVVCREDTVSLTGTDLELELIAVVPVSEGVGGELTIPARKLVDIVRALPDQATVQMRSEGDRVVLQAGRSRFTLSTLPAQDFPAIEEFEGKETFQVSQGAFKKLLEKTTFAMAQQDVRYYLNGLMVELSGSGVKAVASDGHRLALSQMELDASFATPKEIIIPRKGVMELQRLLDDAGPHISVSVGDNHLRVHGGDIVFTTKLIDGKFPDYRRVLPAEEGLKVVANREALRGALSRTAILSNEKYRGVTLELSGNSVRIRAQNPELEEAEEELEVTYSGNSMAIGFNVNYLIDALSAIDDEQVELSVKDQNSSCLLKGVTNDLSRYVVMPMHL